MDWLCNYFFNINDNIYQTMSMEKLTATEDLDYKAKCVRITKGDVVKILTGKFKGESGEVIGASTIGKQYDDVCRVEVYREDNHPIYQNSSYIIGQQLEVRLEGAQEIVISLSDADVQLSQWLFNQRLKVVLARLHLSLNRKD